MVAAVAAAAALACRPEPGLGPVSYTRGALRHVVDLATCGNRVIGTVSHRPSQPFRSPDGRLAASPPSWRPRPLVPAGHRAWGSLTCAPDGKSVVAQSPRFDGATLLFVRMRNGHGALYALRRGRVVGPFASPGFSLGYYGHHAWPHSVRR